MTKLSIVGKVHHTEERVVGFYNAGDRLKVCGRFGGLWGLLFSSAMFVGGLSARGAALLSPMIAATLSFSSVAVIGNALRLRRARA
jgi:hypothetical protein